MLTFGNKVDIYDWFHEMQGWNRMDFLCNLIHLCNAFELRFIGACIEDMAQTDYNTLRDQEIKANSLENLNRFIHRCPPVDEFRSHISVCLALLQSSNYKVASRLAELLDDKLEGHNLEHLMQAGLCAEVEQWMLVLTLAVYHPAVSFQKKLNFKKKLSEYEELSKKEKKNSRFWHTYRCSQSEHPAIKYKDFDEAEWGLEVEPAVAMPFRGYEMHQQRGYGILKFESPAPDPFQGKLPLDSAQDGLNELQNSRSSTFPTTASSSVEFIDNPSVGADSLQKSNSTEIKNSQRSLRTNLLQCGTAELAAAKPLGVEDFVKAHGNPLSLSHAVHCNNGPSSRSTAMQPTVSHSHYCVTATSVSSSVSTTTAIIQSSSQVSNSSKHLSCGNAHRTATATIANPRHFMTIPSTVGGYSELISNRSSYEIQNQRLWDRGRSKSSDTTVKSCWKKPNNVLSESPRQHLRAPTSSPISTEGKEVPSAALSSNFMNGNIDDKANLRDTANRAKMYACLAAIDPMPLRVSVNAIPRNKKEQPNHKGPTSFNLKIEWSDGATSECDHNVEELIEFYKQVSGKTGKNTINTDFLAKQSNQIQEKRKQLEEIFNEVVSSTVSGSNVKDFMTFFNYSAQPASNLPLKKRRYRLGTKPRALVDSGSSSSSTTSPPLINNSKSRLLSPPSSQPVSSVSPSSGTGDVSASSNLSSPSSIRDLRTTTQREEDAGKDNDVTNDPYLKFSKLDPSSIDAMQPFTLEEKSVLNDHIFNIAPEKPSDEIRLDVDMGTLSLSSQEATPLNSDAPSDMNKPMDIKAILDDVARIQSEDEKSGSGRSAPVALEMPNSSVPADDSSSCFSFEFDSASVAPPTRSTRSRYGAAHLDPPPPSEGGPAHFYSSGRYQSYPGRSWSQTDIVSSTENPQSSGPLLHYPSRSAPPFQQFSYYTKPFSSENLGPGHMMVACYPPPMQSMPRSLRAVPTTAPNSQAIPVFTQAPTITSPQPTQPVAGQKPTQYVFTVATQTGALYPVSSHFYPIHSKTSPIGEGPSGPHTLCINQVASTTEAEKLCPTSQKSDLEGWGSSTSSDLDSSKVQDGPVPQNFIPAESVVSNRPGVGPPNCFYIPAPIQHHWVHHPLAPTYSDPGYAIRKEGSEYVDYQVPTNSNGFPLNGYPDIKRYIGPHNQNFNRNRIAPARNFSGDAPKSVISCYNCGRKGHDAKICRDPNAVEVLGTDFHLKMPRGK